MSTTNGYNYEYGRSNKRSISPIERSNTVYTQQPPSQRNQIPIVQSSPIRSSYNHQPSLIIQSPQVIYPQVQQRVIHQTPTNPNQIQIIHQSQPYVQSIQPIQQQQSIQPIYQQQSIQPIYQQQPVVHQPILQQQQQQPILVHQPIVQQIKQSTISQPIRSRTPEVVENRGYDKVIQNQKNEIYNLRNINDEKESRIQELINENHNLNKVLANTDDNRHYIDRIDELEREIQQKQNLNNNQKIQLQHQISQQNQIINELKSQVERQQDDDQYSKSHLDQQKTKQQSLIFLLTLENDRLHNVIKNQYDELNEIDLETQKIRNCPDCIQKSQYYENELKQSESKNQMLLSDNKALHQDLQTMQQKSNYLQSELDKRGNRFNQSKQI